MKGASFILTNQLLYNRSFTAYMHLLPIAVVVLFMLIGLFAFFKQTNVTVRIIRFVNKAFSDDIPCYFSLIVYLFSPCKYR